MAGSMRLALITTAVAALVMLDTAHALCVPRQEAGSVQGYHPVPVDLCIGAWCLRFPYARCEVQDCAARFFVGSTDVTDHCEVDHCIVAGGPDIECNGVCDIDHYTDSPYCIPSCDFNNGGCGDEYACVYERIFCIRAPCPQPVRCIHKNALCNREPDTKSCGVREKAWYYNPASQLCEWFIYGGCEQNHNRFPRRRDCRSTCEGVPHVCFNSIRCPPGTRCKVNDRGEAFCEASCEYDNGGCEEDEICKMRPVHCITFPCPEIVECIPREEVCELEADVGDCRGAFPRYFYNYHTHRCEQFSYGGCGGNENNFFTEEECIATCGEHPCNLVDCAPGTTCEVDDTTGEASCVPTITPCALILCGPGQVCREDERGNGMCVFQDPCATIKCGKPEICRVNPKTQEGYCGVDPCTTTYCSRGYECQYNRKLDDAECVPTAPCLLVDCPTGQICKLDDDTGVAECAPPDLRCMIFDCPAGFVCNVKKGVRSTVECIPDHPCASLDCSSQLCRVDTVSGRGYCGVNPCYHTDCRVGYECRYDPKTDNSECFINLCRTTKCPGGTICRLDDTGRPECVDPCDDVICGTLMCRVNSDTQKGYCGLDPCTYTTCEEGTLCQYDMELDIAQCVSVDPCALKKCSEGNVCEVDDTGEPQCVLGVPDIRCFLLQCAAGFICEVSEDSRSVRCVPEDPCEGVECGALMCRVEAGTRRSYCGLDPCTFTTCETGTECQYNRELDRAVCVRPQVDPCSEVDCELGSVCQVNTAGRPECVFDQRCLLIFCRAGTICDVGESGVPGCVPIPDPCDGLFCLGLEICRVNSHGMGYCGIHPCAHTVCGPNTNCRYDRDTNSGICVPFEEIIEETCSQVRCSPYTQCSLNERSVPECVPICADVLCGRPLVCRINSTTRESYCGASPCRGFTCFNPKTECQYDPVIDGPRCGPIQTGPFDRCSPDPCPPDYRCTTNARGNAECLLLTVG